jgi:sec-independent protein translocase protein TatB
VLGINGSEFIVLLVVAAVVLGPERLPHYAQQLARLIRELRRMAAGAQDKVREELGPDFDDIDWRSFDPRRYDPRRIVRDALSEAVDPHDPFGMAGDSTSRPARQTSRTASTAPQAAETDPPAPAGPGPVFDPDAT